MYMCSMDLNDYSFIHWLIVVNDILRYILTDNAENENPQAQYGAGAVTVW